MGQLVPNHEIKRWGYGKLSKCRRKRTTYAEVQCLMKEKPSSTKIVSIRLRIPAGRLRDAVRSAEALGETLGQCLVRNARIENLPPALREKEMRKRAALSLQSPANRKRAAKLAYSEVIKGQRSETKKRIATAPFGEKIEICLWVRVKDCLVLEKAKGSESLTQWARASFMLWLRWLYYEIDEPMVDTIGDGFWRKRQVHLRE